jgi:hypothetical protein
MVPNGGDPSSVIEQTLFVDNAVSTTNGLIDGALVMMRHPSAGATGIRMENVTAYRNSITVANDVLSGGVFRAEGELTVDLVNVTLVGQAITANGTGSVVGSSISIDATGPVNLLNSIIAQGTLPDCDSSVTIDDAVTLMGDATGCPARGAFLAGDPNFDAFPVGTGHERVLVPMPPSPVIDVTPGTGCSNGDGGTVLVDQRGYVRDDACDLGAADLGALPR